MSKKITCDICGQKTEIYTKAHKTTPFVDGRNYDKVCFGCFNVPRTSEQTYSKDGLIKDHIEFDYSPDYLHTARELTDEGCCDSIKEAKTCLAAVIKLIDKSLKRTKLKGRPKPDWIVV